MNNKEDKTTTLQKFDRLCKFFETLIEIDQKNRKRNEREAVTRSIKNTTTSD